jgi:hypothetical protein
MRTRIKKSLWRVGQTFKSGGVPFGVWSYKERGFDSVFSLLDTHAQRAEIHQTSHSWFSTNDLQLKTDNCLSARAPRTWFGRMGLSGFTKVRFWRFFDLICYHSRHRKPCPRCDPSEATPMWEDSRYFWVVHCKNHWFHLRKNLFFRHRIPLAETDAITLLPLSIAALRPDAISVARSISISPQKCSGSSKNPLSHSLHIRYSVMKKLPGNPCFAPGVPHQLGRSSPTSLLSAGGNFHFSFFYFLPRGEGQSKKIEGATGV